MYDCMAAVCIRRLRAWARLVWVAPAALALRQACPRYVLCVSCAASTAVVCERPCSLGRLKDVLTFYCTRLDKFRPVYARRCAVQPQGIVPDSPVDFTVGFRGGKGRKFGRRFVVTAPRAPSGGVTAAPVTHYEVQMDGVGAVRTVALGTSVNFPHEGHKRVPHTLGSVRLSSVHVTLSPMSPVDCCVHTRVRLVVSFQAGSQVARVHVSVYFHEPYPGVVLVQPGLIVE